MLENIDNNFKKLLDEISEEKIQKVNFVPGISPIPVSGKVIDKEDIAYLVDSSLDAWFTSGRYTSEFEKSISKYLGTRHCLFVNSGSSANLLAVTALKQFYNLKDGDEIITSAVGFPTTVNPIIQNNLVPVLIDAEMDTYNIDVSLIEKSINDRTKGIVIAHTLGNPFELETILSLCEKYDLFLMEDNCDSFGSTYNGQFTGTFGDISTLSFYPAHHITTGEGGAVITNKPKLKKLLESLRDWGRDCYCPPGEDNTCKKRYEWQLGDLPYGYDHKYIYSNIGYNLKSSDMQAALGVSQIKKLPEFVEKRKNNFNFLYNKFSELDDFILPKKSDKSDPSWFGFPLTISENSKINRVDLLRFYEERRIGTRLLFGGNLSLQPAYQNTKFNIPGPLTKSEHIMNNTFWLGVYPGLNEEMLSYVFESTKEFIS
tara:strand:+ start:334 stop:1620 length:1287 start_codon:yes stop_codon:yes gene_type:complete